MRPRLLMAFLLAVSWPATALAADEPTPNALLRQGAELFKQQDYEGARAAFARAYELAPKAATLFNLGLSELNSDHPVEAAKHLREYLAHAEEPGAKLESVRTKWLPRAEARTAQLEVFAPSAAEVAVDGIVQEHGASTVGGEGQGGPLASIVVSAGEHDVSARQGAAIQTQHVSARGGELVELHFQRVPDATPAEPLGWSAVGSGQDRETLQRASRAKWTTVIALGSGAVVAAGLGVGFAVAAQNRASDFRAVGSELDAHRLDCTGGGGNSAACMRLKDDTDANRQDWAISTAAYVGGGVLAAASVATWMLWRTDGPRAASVLFRPMLGARTAGLEIGGHW